MKLWYETKLPVDIQIFLGFGFGLLIAAIIKAV